MRMNRRSGAAATLGLVYVAVFGGCDIVAGIGTYCTEGKDPGCGTTGTSGAGGTGAMGGGTSSAGTAGTTGNTGGTGGIGGGVDCSPAGTTLECYTGSAATKGVGICKAGTQTCQENGKWGPCDGEVLPGTETCASALDEDCDQKECALWSLIFGDAENQAVQDVAVDPSGNILVLGFFQGALTGLQPELMSAGADDLFLLKLKPTGEVLWAKKWGDSAEQGRGRMAVDGQGNIIIVGSYQGTLDFGSPWTLSPKGGGDIYVAKLDADGNALWAKGIGDSKAQAAYDVAVDELGDILVVGAFSGTVNFGDVDVPSSGLNDAFVAKFASGGFLSWKRVYGDAMSQQADSVAVNANGDVLFSGIYSGSMVFAGKTLSDSGQRYFAKISSDGVEQWAKSFPVFLADVAASSDGTWWLAGSVVDPVDFGGGSLPAGGGYDAFIARLDSNGGYINAKRFGGAGNDGIEQITVDSAGNLLFTGSTDSGVDFGTGPLLSAGSLDLLVGKFSPSLTISWARRFGDEQIQGFGHLATDASDFVYVGAKVDGKVNFGAGDLVSKGNDVVVVKLAP